MSSPCGPADPSASQTPSCIGSSPRSLGRLDMSWADGYRALIHKSRPHELLCGCETTRTDALFKRKGQDEVRRGSVYGIHAVVTPQRYRGTFLHHTLSGGSHNVGRVDVLPTQLQVGDTQRTSSDC